MPLSASSCSVLLASCKFSSYSYAYPHLLTYSRQKESGQLQHNKYYIRLNPPCSDRGGLGSARPPADRQAVSTGSDFSSSHHPGLLAGATLWRPILLSANHLFFLFLFKENEIISETLRTADLTNSKPPSRIWRHSSWIFTLIAFCDTPQTTIFNC